MLVVADSSPLIVLINIGEVGILQQIFGQVVIPPQVADELKHANRPPAVRDFANAFPAWIVVRTPKSIQSIATLHAGEIAAISLAEELNADLLLIDDLDGRRVAADRHIAFTGTIGILELAADKKLLDLRHTFAMVKQTDFWISHELLEKRLQMHESRTRSGE